MNNVIIACDFENKEILKEFLTNFKTDKPMLKIGMELFYSEGPELVRELKELGFSIFLDLKLHDIPNTVEKAMYNIGKLGVDLTNVHAAGGVKMMEAAKRGLEKANANTKLIAVTQLTSTDDTMLKDELLIETPMNATITKYAENTKAAGLDGVVCSPLESTMIHEACGDAFLTVTPGIRQASDSKDDQKRVTTPTMARELGSNYIVVGRSITKAKQPDVTYRQIWEEMNHGA